MVRNRARADAQQAPEERPNGDSGPDATAESPAAAAAVAAAPQRPAVASAPPSAPAPPAGLNLKVLKDKKINELAQLARDFNVEGSSAMRKQELIFAILHAQTEHNGFIYGEGVLEILPDGFAFLRAPDYNYLPGPDESYIS